jgi:hypothetical protein
MAGVILGASLRAVDRQRRLPARSDALSRNPADAMASFWAAFELTAAASERAIGRARGSQRHSGVRARITAGQAGVPGEVFAWRSVVLRGRFPSRRYRMDLPSPRWRRDPLERGTSRPSTR